MRQVRSGGLDILRFIYTRLRPEVLLVSGFLALVGGLSFALDVADAVRSQGALICMVAVALAILSLIPAAFQTWRGLTRPPRCRFEAAREFEVYLSKLVPPPMLIQDGYEVVHAPRSSEPVLRSATVDRLVRSQTIRFRMSGDKARRTLSAMRKRAGSLQEALWLQYRICKNPLERRHFVNESKVAMATDLALGSTQVTLTETDYFTSWLTNEMCSRALVDQSTDAVVLHGPDLYPAVDVEGSREVLPLSESSLGDHVGISTVAHTKDGQLVIWQQAGSSLQSRGLLAPTGSGSCDLRDLGSSELFNDVLIRAMNRELCEEADRRHVLGPEEIAGSAVLGYYRWLRRGGKPEFVGLTKLAVDASQLDPDRFEVKDWHVRSWPARNRSELLSSLELMLKEGPLLSVPLWANLEALKHALAEDEPRWLGFCGIS